MPVQQPYEEKELPTIEHVSRDSAEVPVQQPYEEKELPTIKHVESTPVAPQKVDVKPTEVNENSNGLAKIQNPRDIVVVRMEP